jgi:hypothetical protein
MGHLVHAASQLITEVGDLVKDAKVETLPEEDGLGFNRSIRFDLDTSKSLPDEVVQALESDDRIESIVKSNKGVRVTFVPDPRADSAAPFGVAEGAAVLSEG